MKSAEMSLFTLSKIPTFKDKQRRFCVMQLLIVIRLLLTFYRNFLISTNLLTGCCVWILLENGLGSVIILFWFKVITLALIFTFVNSHKSKEFFYYQNLGLSRRLLWISTLAFDLLIFICAMGIASQFI